MALAPRFITSTLPIRLIDIPATQCSHGGICFVDPQATGWDFHVISHTWSKRVRDLSDVVASTAQESQCRGTAYSQGFQNANFRSEPAYIELMKFFQLLAGDHVQRVWFDALCINQMDQEEKSKEICRMGSYYGNSKGCYVLIHGVGQGYHLWSSSGGKSALLQDKFPRWFTRAWTFQEFMLPEKLYFLVAPSLWTVGLLNRRIEAQGSAMVGFCKCCLLPLDVYHQVSKSPLAILRSCGVDSIMMPIDFLLSNKEDLVVMEAGVSCCVCGTPPLVRAARDQKNLYFVERDAYIFLASLELWLPPPGCYYVLPSVPFKSVDYDVLVDLYQLHLKGRTISYSQIVNQIGYRACSVPEDRILCILGMLGIDGFGQLRTKKTLESQIVEVAKICKADTLIGLSMVDYYGNHSQHMSWAPPLTGHSTMLHKLQLAGPMQREAEVLGVSSKGYVRIRSTVLHGWFKLGIPIFITGNVYAEIVDITKQGSGIVSLVISCCSEEGIRSRIGAAQVPLLRFTDLQREAIEFPLWMIVLGSTTDSFNETRIITMVCMGKDKYKGGGRESLVLHKIGLVLFPLSLAKTLISMCGCRRKCILGGFGRILNDYIVST